MRTHKRIGPNIRTLANPTMEKVFGIYDNIQKIKEDARKEAQRIEKERIDKIKCPSCKSTDKKHVVKRDSNGVCGPGYATWITDEYFVCKDCGTRFEDLTKINDE